MSTYIKQIMKKVFGPYNVKVPTAAFMEWQKKELNMEQSDKELRVAEDQKEYIYLYHSLRLNNNINHSRLVVPFASQELPGYRDARIKIMYVGKATGQGWGFDILSKDDLAGTTGTEIFLKQSQFCTKNFLAAVEEGEYHSPFWSHARRISEMAQSLTQDGVRFPKNLIWTNTAKLGVLAGNPQGEYLKVQLSLARRSLLNEISLYEPDLIYVCTGRFANGDHINNPDIVHSVFGDIEDSRWNKPSADIWWRLGLPERYTSFTGGRKPVVVITDHPQGVRREKIQNWIETCRQILNNENFG